MFTLFTVLVGLECAVVAVFFFAVYVIGLVAIALVWPLWGWPFLSFNLLCWVKGSQHLHRWLVRRYGPQNFPKEVDRRRNLPSALD